MKASFTYAIRYLVNATCVSPLRTGNADNDIDRILTTPEGLAMVQGASIAGAMKAWLGSTDPEALFGDEEIESAVSVSDAVFTDGTVASTRPRVPIDQHTGTSANKFDIAGLPTGAVCSFEVLWRGSKEDAPSAAQKLEQCFSAIASGEITFGAQRSNGYGRMNITVHKCSYDLFDRDDRLAWLDDRVHKKELVALGRLAEKDIVFDVEADIDAILVKSAAPIRKGEKSVQIQFTENGIPILPGSSLKGAMCAHIRRIADFLSVSRQELDMLLGREARGGTDTGVCCKPIWTDATADVNTKRIIITRIRINRITGSVMQGHLISEEPVSGRWQWQISVPAKEQRGAMLVLYALRDLGLGLYQLGGTQAVGRGAVRRLTVGIRSGEQEAVFSVDRQTPHLEDPDGIVSNWEEMMGGAQA